MTKRSSLAVAVALTLAAPGAAWATNGYFSHGYGTTSKGLAGAGVAMSQDSLAAATNPAGMVTIGNRVDGSLAIFSPRRSYTVEGSPSFFPETVPLEPGKVDSDSNYFAIPGFGYNRMINPDMSFGVSVYGNGGMNTDYPAQANPQRGGPGNCPDGTFCAGATGVDLMQLFIAPTFAHQATPQFAWGISPIIAYQRFKATGLASFGANSADSNSLSDNGTDDSFGFGGKIGVQGEVMPGLRLGASYQTKIKMDEFDKYRGLFAEQGNFDIPATATIGLAFDPAPQHTVLFDVQRIWYSDVAAIGNPMMPNLANCDGGNGDASQCLGGDNGPGFGWRNMTIYKLGYQWEQNADWTWRAGYSYGKQPIPESEVMFNILAPAVMEHHFTAGFTRRMGDNQELNFAAMYAPKRSVRGDNPMEAPGQQTIELEMSQFEIELGYAWRF